MRVRNCLLQLKSNRLWIRRAIPTVIDRTRHTLWIASCERIFRLGESADVYAAHCAGLAENRLRGGDRGHQFIDLIAPRKNDAAPPQPPSGKRDQVGPFC